MEINRENYGMKISIFGMILNFILSAFKLIVGNISNSSAIVVDGFNNLLDGGTFLVTFVAFKIAKKPNSHFYPFGYARIEYLSSLVVSITILLVGIELVKTSIYNIFSPSTLVFTNATFLVLIISIIVKLAMALYTKVAGDKINSVSLKAVSLDSFTDSIATLFTFLSYLIAFIFKVNIDGYASLIASLFILYTAYKSIKDSVNPLLGKRESDQLSRDVNNIIKDHNQVLATKSLMLHAYGENRLYGTVNLVVPDNLSTIDIASITKDIYTLVKDKYNIDLSMQVIPESYI